VSAAVVDQFRVELVERVGMDHMIRTRVLAGDAQAAGDLHAALHAIAEHCQTSAYVQITHLRHPVSPYAGDGVQP
jgi:hypothetical protein